MPMEAELTMIKLPDLSQLGYIPQYINRNLALARHEIVDGTSIR
jgi:hypothetical protein